LEWEHHILNVPSITVFVRHSADCRHKAEEFYRRCKCPKHLRWTHGSKQYRESAKTRSWEIAEEKRRERELQFKAADPSTPINVITADAKSRPTIERAIDLFVSNKQSQGVDAEVLGKYQTKPHNEVKTFASLLSKFETRFTVRFENVPE
jgi:integrase/recombinase XerD